MDSTLRFSDRVENYAKYRPSYPSEVLDLLQAECGLKAGSSVADVGSGTGISARLLLDRGFKVFGVEPNDAMREYAEQDLASNPHFESVAGQAESTGLEARSIDLVLAAQAFHWFDRERFRAECLRILKPGGWTTLIWNNRQTHTEFLRKYDELLQTGGVDYGRVDHRNITREQIQEFYGSAEVRFVTFPNRQLFGWEGLLGRVLSSSYVPLPGDERYEPMVTGLMKLFEAYQVDGQVPFEYETEVHYGQPT